MPTKTKQLSVRTLQVYVQTLKDAIGLLVLPGAWSDYFHVARSKHGTLQFSAAGAIIRSYRHFKVPLGEEGWPQTWGCEEIGDFATRFIRPALKKYPQYGDINKLNDIHGHIAVMVVLEESLAYWQRRLRKALKARKGVAA
jgi:hypothetical protein